MKGNAPFKDRLRALLNPDLRFRWDLLHLINKAYEASKSFSVKGIPFTLKQLMENVQGTSKTWRSGLDFTNLKLSTLNSFKRPKVWSDTRMCPYEYDQLDRFLECSVYWENPWWVDVLTRLYLPVTFTLKIMLKKVQSVKVKQTYIKRVFTGTSPEGKTAMKKVLKIAVAAIEGKGYDEHLQSIPDVMSTETGEDNHFVSVLNKWIGKHADSLLLKETSATTTKREANVTITDLYQVVDGYIIKLFSEIQDRLNYCDFGGTTAWSEAPAEGIFSIWKQVITGRESLKVVHTEALCRIMHDGPYPSTNAAEELMMSASTKWPAEKGTATTTVEFTTKDWRVRFVQKVISQLKSGSSTEDDSDDED